MLRNEVTDNYAEGDLGVIYRHAKVVSLPEVAELLEAKMKLFSSGMAVPHEASLGIMQRTKEAVEEQQDYVAAVGDIRRVRKFQLRLKQGDDAVLLNNEHLENLTFDQDGNVIATPAGAMGPGDDLDMLDGGKRRPLLEFELIMLATLLPQTLTEAVALIPSLRVYDEEDLWNAIQTLQSSM